MVSINQAIFDRLTKPGPRIPWITRWLLEEVWNQEHYQKNKPLEYLYQGEEAVNHFESLIAAAADRTYGELLANPDPSKSMLGVLAGSDTALVVFDGLSLREIPLVLSLASQSGFKALRVDTSLGASPSETIDYVARELPCGRIAPSQLPGRRELKEKGIVALYSGNYTQGISGEYEGSPLIVWSSFPDLTYRDSGARFENHFETIHLLFETVWMNTVQQIKGKKTIIITSDHGYIFFGHGLDFPRSTSELTELNRYFGNDRNAWLAERPDPPKSDDIFIDTARNVAMIKGRIKTRSTGEAAARLYKHGGLSLMEMLTPWIVLEAGP